MVRFLCNKTSPPARHALVLRLCCQRLWSSLRRQLDGPPSEALAALRESGVNGVENSLVRLAFPVGGRQLPVLQQRKNENIVLYQEIGSRCKIELQHVRFPASVHASNNSNNYNNYNER